MVNNITMENNARATRLSKTAKTKPLKKGIPTIGNFYDEFFFYTGGILQRLDTDVHSAVTAMVRIVMLQR